MAEKHTTIAVPPSLLIRLRDIQTDRMRESGRKPTLAEIIIDALDSQESNSYILSWLNKSPA